MKAPVSQSSVCSTRSMSNLCPIETTKRASGWMGTGLFGVKFGLAWFRSIFHTLHILSPCPRLGRMSQENNLPLDWLLPWRKTLHFRRSQTMPNYAKLMLYQQWIVSQCLPRTWIDRIPNLEVEQPFTITIISCFDLLCFWKRGSAAQER